MVDIRFNEVGYRKLTPSTNGLSNFVCSKSRFQEYLRVTALSDQAQQIGQTWVFIYETKIIGFITIAMGHMKQEDHEDLRVDGFGNIPALLIGYLATHKNYEKSGLGKYMVSWAINKAVEYSQTIGCRIVMLNPEDDVIEFYQKQGFTLVPHDTPDHSSMFVDILQE